jgi:putative transposase
MKKTRFTETQIVFILQQQEVGRITKELPERTGFRGHYLQLEEQIWWYGGFWCKGLRDLEKGNSRIKKRYAHVAMDNHNLHSCGLI